MPTDPTKTTIKLCSVDTRARHMCKSQHLATPLSFPRIYIKPSYICAIEWLGIGEMYLAYTASTLCLHKTARSFRYQEVPLKIKTRKKRKEQHILR